MQTVQYLLSADAMVDKLGVWAANARGTHDSPAVNPRSGSPNAFKLHAHERTRRMKPMLNSKSPTYPFCACSRFHVASIASRRRRFPLVIRSASLCRETSTSCASDGEDWGYDSPDAQTRKGPQKRRSDAEASGSNQRNMKLILIVYVRRPRVKIKYKSCISVQNI